jgi:plastocyanin
MHKGDPRRASVRRPATLLIVGAAVILAAASLGTGQTSAAPGPIIIEITDAGYNPAHVTISRDSTVTWTNVGSETHSVTGEPGGVLDSPAIAPRFTYSYTFHATGTFSYHDASNHGFNGTVVVVDGAAAPQPTPHTPSTAPSSPSPTIPLTPTPSGVGEDDAAAGDEPSPEGAHSAPSALSDPTRSLQGTAQAAPAPQALPSLANATTVEIGNEWFGGPSFQSAVHETVIQTGEVIEWRLSDGLHNVYECGDNWSEAATSCAAAGWNSDQVMTAGGTFSRTFASSGDYYYLCTIHPATMRGRVVVEETQNAPADTSADSPERGRAARRYG